MLSEPTTLLLEVKGSSSNDKLHEDRKKPFEQTHGSLPNQPAPFHPS